MRKSVFSRIVWMLLLNCVVFVLLVMMQFTRRGNFSQRIGDMLVSGRYDLTVSGETAENSALPGRRLLGEGLSVFFGGLEFSFDVSPGGSAGFGAADTEGRRRNLIPEYITVTNNEAVVTLTGGTGLSFKTYDGTLDSAPELHISGNFSGDIASITIPFKTQRSSVIRDNGTDTLTIAYNGSYYQFSPAEQSLEAGQLVLSAAVPLVSYGIIPADEGPQLADFIVPQAETAEAFSGALADWSSGQFDLWGRSMSSQTDEDMVIAWCAEAVRQGRYRGAVSAVPVSFSSNPQRSWESAVYQFDRKIGVWAEQVYVLGRVEREKTGRITRLTAASDRSLFEEQHLVTFLAVRGQDRVLNDLLAFTQKMDPAGLTLSISPGILECYSDMITWRPDAENPFAPFTEQICHLIAGRLRRTEDQVWVTDGGRADIILNLRLGKALWEWGEQSGNQEWAAIGRTLALSVISLTDASGSVPASLEIDGNGVLTPSEQRISSAKLYRLLGTSEYLPHATATGTGGVWAWTAASSIQITQSERVMDISVQFPVGETHYVMIRDVRPISLLQIYGMDWRNAYDFESYYNSSGWYYFEREQTLILKISHRSNTERIRVYFTVPRPSAPVVQPLPSEAQTAEETPQL